LNLRVCGKRAGEQNEEQKEARGRRIRSEAGDLRRQVRGLGLQPVQVAGNVAEGTAMISEALGMTFRIIRSTAA
jgi:hypothetical protein